jgi:hypothetical protein
VHGGVRTRTKDLGAFKRVKIRAQLVCFKGQWLLGCPSDQEGQAGGDNSSIQREGAVGLERGVAQGTRGKGWFRALGFVPPVAGLGQLGGRPGWLEEKEKKEREKKEMFNLASFKLNVFNKLSYVITLIKQYLCNYMSCTIINE